MQIQDLMIDPARQWPAHADSWQPLGFVDLDALNVDVREIALPPFPLIGLGDRAHPLATVLDAVLEPPMTPEALVREVAKAPKAAAAAVQLLRSVDGLSIERALTLESLCYGMLQGSAEHAAWLAARAPCSRARWPTWSPWLAC